MFGRSSRLAVFSLAVVGLVGAVAPVSAAEKKIKAGDKVKVTSGPAAVKVGTKTLATVEAGTELTVLKVKGRWVKVRVQREGKAVTGWIDSTKHLGPAAGRPDEGGEAVRTFTVTDTQGVRVEISDPRIDYTPDSFMYTPDFEDRGLRAYQAEGKLTVEWSRLAKVTILGKRTDVQPHRLKGELALRSGKTIACELETGSELRSGSKCGLYGDTDLGHYWIRLDEVKTIAVPQKPESRQRSPRVKLLGLTVTDKKGNVVEVREARIDYTSYAMFYTPEFERDGLRVRLGKGALEIPWGRISRVQILGKSTGAAPDSLRSEIALEGGGKREFDLVGDSKEGLFGKTDLGDFSIRLERVQSIVVRKERM